jgi:hypothetical protein
MKTIFFIILILPLICNAQNIQKNNLGRVFAQIYAFEYNDIHDTANTLFCRLDYDLYSSLQVSYSLEDCKNNTSFCISLLSGKMNFAINQPIFHADSLGIIFFNLVADSLTRYFKTDTVYFK